MSTCGAAELPVRWRGAIALAAVIVLWSTFALTMRGLGYTTLTPIDAAFLRFATPVVLLAPWVPRAVREVRRERASVLVMLAAGGLPHFLLSVLGGRLTSAALVGILLPGTVPLFVALILALSRRERASRRRVLSLAVIVVGVVATAVLTPSAAATAGVIVLLAGGCAWAVYSIALRETALSLTSTVLAVSAPAAAGAALLALTGTLPSHLLSGDAVPRDALWVAVLQGIGTGLASTLAYAVAVRELGSARAATWGALSPVLTVVAAVPLLHEAVTAAVAVALVLVVGGVVAYHGGTRDTRAVGRRAGTIRLWRGGGGGRPRARRPLPQ